MPNMQNIHTSLLFYILCCILVQTNMHNMQINMQIPKSICRIVTCVYSAYWLYICTPHFADARCWQPRAPGECPAQSRHRPGAGPPRPSANSGAIICYYNILDPIIRIITYYLLLVFLLFQLFHLHIPDYYFLLFQGSAGATRRHVVSSHCYPTHQVMTRCSIGPAVPETSCGPGGSGGDANAPTAQSGTSSLLVNGSGSSCGDDRVS